MKTPEIIPALIQQVTNAARGRVETEVVTLITRPMWRRFMSALGDDPDAEPTDWSLKNCRRVYGSLTIVVESDIEASISFLRGFK